LLSFLTSTLRSAKTAHPLAVLVYGSLSLPKVVEADVLVLAGDIHLDPEIRSVVIARTEDQLGFRFVHVSRNHDFYGSHFANDRGELFTI
jgi:hypothetical protein